MFITKIENLDNDALKAGVEFLANKLGVEINYLTKGKYKDMGNPFRDVTDDEQNIINSFALIPKIGLPSDFIL